MDEVRPGQRVGDYEFLDRLAVGGMGQLWRVRHVTLGAIYVAKVLRPELRDDPEFAKRFLHEARLVANLKHPNVVQVFGYDEEHMLYFMEYVEGMDLDRLMRRRRTLEFREKRVIIEAVADTIGYAHRHFDLIHRDIKPSNVLIAILDPEDPIQRTHIKLTDFGIAKVLSLDQRVTISSGVVMGTVHYMAPEQFEGNADKPSDVYSIGILYYQLLTGKLPFDGPTAFVVRDKHLHEVPPAPNVVNPNIPLDDSDIVMRCLEKDPAKRFPDAADLFRELTTKVQTSHTVTLPHARERASGPAAAEEPVEPTERLERPRKPPTRRAPAVAEEPPPGPPTRATEAAPSTTPTIAAPARPRRRLWPWVAGAGAAALVVLGLLAVRGLGPKRGIRWDTVASARSLVDFRDGVAQVAALVGKGAGTQADRARLSAYQAAATSLGEAAAALGDGQCDKAEERLDTAEAELRQVPGGDAAGLPRDFPFCYSLRTALGQAKERVRRAERLVERLDPVTDSTTSIQYTLDKFRGAAAAVSDSLAVSPGLSAYRRVRGQAEAGGDIESLLRGLGGGLPPPLVAALGHLAKIDGLLEHAPGGGLEGFYWAGILRFLDEGVGAAGRLDRAAWFEVAFAKEEIAFLDDLPARFWREAHRRRLADVAARCRKLVADRLGKAPALPSGLGGKVEAKQAFEETQACLEAVRKATRLSEKEKAEATGLLGTCCVKRAIQLFCLGARAPEEEEEHFAAVLKLLDRGLDELPGCAADAQADGMALRQVLGPASQARGKLATCRRENFAAPGVPGGAIGTLFGALAAHERLLKELGPNASRPFGRAALEPFARLKSESCGGFTLPNAAAWWLLASAARRCEKGEYADAARGLGAFELEPGQEERKVESTLKRLLPAPIVAKATALAKLAACFDETKVPAEGVPAAGRWKKVWDARLAAKPLLGIEIPQTVGPEALPQAHQGEETQWEALFGEMRKLQAHYRGRIQAEEDLREAEGETAKLVLRTADSVRANPATATTEAVAKCSALVAQLKASGRFKEGDDHPSRFARLESDALALRTGVVGRSERIAELLARPDPKAALDELRDGGGVLGEAKESELTRQALTAWVKMATKDIKDGDFGAALEKLKAIGQHEQVRRLAAEPTVKAVLDETVRPLLYCEGQRSLALGAQGFAAALPKFQQAAPFRDAEAIAKQLGAFQDAYALRETEPFKAAAGFSQLLKDKGLNPKLTEVAERASREIRDTFLAGAAACVKGFNGALVRGGWEDYLDRTAYRGTPRANPNVPRASRGLRDPAGRRNRGRRAHRRPAGGPTQVQARAEVHAQASRPGQDAHDPRTVSAVDRALRST